MHPDGHDWRFFTQLVTDNDAAGHLWCWVELDADGREINSGSGFYTVIAAMHDAKAHGFPGPVELPQADDLLKKFGDRRACAIRPR